MLKILLELNKIANYGQKTASSHFITQLLSTLKCINDTQRSFIYGM